MPDFRVTRADGYQPLHHGTVVTANDHQAAAMKHAETVGPGRYTVIAVDDIQTLTVVENRTLTVNPGT
jgi:hypothetical protein